MGASDGIRSSHVCSVVVSSPQAGTFGFNPPYTDRLLHSICISFSPRNLSCISSSIPSVQTLVSFLLVWQQSSVFFTTYISYIPCQHLFCIVSHLCWSFFLFSPTFVSPEHISYFSSCHPFYSEIFETCSCRSIATVSLQDVVLTSYIPPLWESHARNISLLQRRVIVYVSVCVWIEFVSLAPQGVRETNCMLL